VRSHPQPAGALRKGAFDLTLIKRERAASTIRRHPVLAGAAGVGDVGNATSNRPPDRCRWCLARAMRLSKTCNRGTRPCPPRLADWPITSVSLAGQSPPSRPGLGVTVLPRTWCPPGLHVVDGFPLPDLKDTEIALLHQERLSDSRT